MEVPIGDVPETGKPRIFAYGNSIMSTSGFAVVARNILTRLTDEYEVFAQGIEHLTMPQKCEGVLCLPTGRDLEGRLGADAIPQYLDLIKPDYMITFLDLHQLHFVPNFEKWIKCITVDCTPINTHFRSVLQRGYLNIIPNKFGYDALREWGAPVEYIPFGVDTKIFKPMITDAFPNLEGKIVFGCYDEKTEILTENGFKLFKDLQIGEKVFTRSSEGKLELQEVLENFEYDHEGEMIHFLNRSIDLLVTPDHNMLVTDQYAIKTHGKPNFKPANMIKPGQKIPKSCKWEGEEIEFFILKPCVNERDWGPNGRWTEKRIRMDDWLAFFGIWIAEGYTTDLYRIGISQSREKNPEKWKKIKELLSKLPFNFWPSGDNGFIMSDKTLYEYLKQFGKSRDKFIPKELKQLSKRQLAILLAWWTEGDGYHGKLGNWEIITSSEKLVSDIQELALKLGFVARATLNKPGNRFVSTNPVWNVRIDDRREFYSLQLGSIQRESYKGKVFCCSVPNHTVYVRRNGICVWCGNCVGRNTERKRWDRLLRAFADIEKDCKDAVLICFTDPREPFELSIDPESLSRTLGIEKKVFFPQNLILQRSAVTVEQMAKIFNRFDVHISTAEREGFGLPVVETMACGVPNIVVGYSAPPEIVENAGIVINDFDWTYHSQFNYRGALVNVKTLAREMRILYDDDKLRAELGKRSRIRSFQYDWDKVVVPIWKKLLHGHWMQEL